MRILLYNLFKVYIKTVFFFYSKKIKIEGRENIPETGAVLFTANHPNGLLDPILIASSIKRKTHFLVKSGAFKNPKVAILCDWLGMLPVYRVRNGIRQVAKNNLVFKKCRKLLKDQKVLLIFPEGTHNKKRTIRPLSKGFTRIVFGTLDEQPDLKINIIPVGLTYQNSSVYPSGIALHFGRPILVNDFYNPQKKFDATNNLKKEVTQELQALTVHIDNNESFEKINNSLNNTVKDFTEVNEVNQIIKSKNDSKDVVKKSSFSLLKILVIINSILPYLFWKIIDKKNTEIEFRDTFRYVINSITFPLYYALISIVLSQYFNWKIGLAYFTASLLLVFVNTKTSKI